MNIFLSAYFICFVCYALFSLLAPKKQTTQGFSPCRLDSIFIPGLVFELNLMTLPFMGPFFV